MKLLSMLWAAIWLLAICGIVAAGVTVMADQLLGFTDKWVNFGVLWLICVIIVFACIRENR